MSGNDELKIFVISDSTGDTGQMIIRAVLSQFHDFPYKMEKFSHVSRKEDILLFLDKIEKEKGIVAYTVILPEIKKILENEIKRRSIQGIDLLGHALSFFYSILGYCPIFDTVSGQILDQDYFNRVEALNFTVRCDDGRDLSALHEADVILIGISRTSKTPLSMYLAYRGYRVINLPLVPEVKLPFEIFSIPPQRIVGLVVDPMKLKGIRTQRLRQIPIHETASYATLDRIKEEMIYAQKMMEKIGCRVVDVSNRSIEEVATEIINAI